MFIRVGGVQGSGKTVFITELLNLLKERGEGVERVSGSEVMASFLGVPLAELRLMPEDKKQIAREQMFDFIYSKDKENPEKLFLRDAHFCILDKETLEIIEIPPREGDESQMLAFILLSASPETIYKRRVSDKARRDDRCVENSGLLQREIYEERKTAIRQAAALGIPLIILYNENVSLKKVAAKAVDELISRGLLS